WPWLKSDATESIRTQRKNLLYPDLPTKAPKEQSGITDGVPKDTAIRITPIEAKRRADWTEFRRKANASWANGLKVPAGTNAMNIKVDLVPIPDEPTFTVFQTVNKGLINKGAKPGFQGDSISVSVRSDTAGGLGFGQLEKDKKLRQLNGRDGEIVIRYVAEGWSKT